MRDYHVIPTAKDLPICTPDGFFAKLQSDAVTSTYYCSDREGNAIETFHGIAQNSAQGTSNPNYIDVQRARKIYTVYFLPPDLFHSTSLAPRGSR